MGFAGVNGERGRRILRRSESLIEQASFDQAPARISTLLHRLIRETSGVDPYRRVKAEYNHIALEKLPAVRALVAAGASSGPEGGRLAGGVRAAIAGNVIDFGIYDTIDLDRSLREAFRFSLSGTDFQKFSSDLSRAARVLYLCDNAGEIVFDRVLIEILRGMGKEVTAAVKGVPVINDATMEDAEAAGLPETASAVIHNGNDGIGTLLELCSDEFMAAYRSADLIISKGQANYETLVPVRDDRVYFLFKVKCPVVAAALGRQDGDIILMDNRKDRCIGDR
jgi:uncharacterized protein with ATP-grasp and redox domains